MSDAFPTVDVARLVADLRSANPRLIKQAYETTFHSELGRLVLAHHMVECGIGNHLGKSNLKYRAGMHDGALSLAAKAGFDQASIAGEIIGNELQGGTDEVDFGETRTLDEFD